MPQSLSNILLHVIFSTKNRRPFVEASVEDELWRYLATTCTACGCQAHRVGGTGDHIHIVSSLGRTVAVSKLIERIKASPSKWMKTKGVPAFAWQNGYGAFSIGQSQLDEVVTYVARQREHHRQRTFQEEYLEFLRRYRVPYDERYVWD